MIDAVERGLLAAAQAGDYDAFDTLHTRLQPALSRFVRRLIGDAVEAEDVVQDTLLALFMNLKQIDPPEKLYPYLYRVARNRCYDILRHQGRWEKVSADTDEDDPIGVRIAFDIASAVGETTPEDAANWLLMLMEVKSAIERLPELQRQALILYCDEELSYAEIAEVMECSIGTVKSRLFHAKRSLRGLIPPRTLAAISDELGLWDDTKGEMDNDGRGQERETARLRERAEGTTALN